MTSDLPIRVVFFQVRETVLKLQRIAETAQTHFEKKEPFLIFVEDAKAQQFVDDLLWKFPETSFLPHMATDDTTKEWIVVTKLKRNINGARAAFNLCPTPLLIEGSFRIIYEFEDLTSPSKKQLSAVRFDAYKEARCLIEAR
ncbi:MAG: DNA polymerase III subunit chi [Verrucomicrobia bacterium]|nr:DNA polymerase III subunit chi [Verrucomicrobiota bacterium]